METKCRILIADDHPVFLHGLRQVIENDGALEIVAESRNGEEALAQIRAVSPDIAVVDIAMPKLDGLELAKLICEEQIAVSVILLTMYREKGLFDRALELGVKGYVLKDSAVSDIVNSIRAVAKGEHYVSSALTTYLI